jgi:type IV secretion system protein VirB6/type IV secretion system protein TrbL
MKHVLLISLAGLLLCGFAPSVKAGTGTTFVDAISSQYSASAQQWETSIKHHAVKLFWILAVISAAWTFAVVVLKQGDLADLVGAAVRFIVTTMFFYWLLDRGPDFAGDILRSTLQLAGDATGTKGLDWGAFANMGVKIFMEVNRHISVWNAVVAVSAGVVAILILVVLCLITVNLILVNCETWIKLSAGLIFLGFGAAEWTRDLSVSYYKHLLAVGIKQFVTLLIAGIGLDIMNSLYVAAGKTGWGADLQALAIAFASALILLLLVSKVPASVAGICGVSSGETGAYGMSTLFAGAGMGAQAAAMASGVGTAAMAGGRSLGSAVRNAVKQGQALSKGKP